MGGFGPLFFYIHMVQERDCKIKKPVGNNDYAKRICLVCNKRFNSQSKGNRRCGRCKQAKADDNRLPEIWQMWTPVPDTITRKTRSSFIKSFGYRKRPEKRNRSCRLFKENKVVPNG